ncbi:hypothetical protein EUGRSUZ_E01378 [Eucalyptus grandis]|uniref:Uncharacterized protein n=2 Tax=Eucalyptus grandis TaxID=71139 RepID=A0ACC3KTX4_EUCGR|nr:hypothetical protein EUGRSUZ_E01378 [Eucalyptus grandis]
MLCCFALHAHLFIPSTTTSRQRLRRRRTASKRKGGDTLGKRLLSLVYAKRSAGGDDSQVERGRRRGVQVPAQPRQ